MSRRTLCARDGFTALELLFVVAIMMTALAAVIPTTMGVSDAMRLSMAMRDVERELQTARLKAVSVNRPLRVRFNCPSTGMLRIVEVTGVSATDNAGNRCSETAFPYPGPRDANPATPAHDGPVRRINPRVQLSPGEPALTLQFSPDGRVAEMVSGSPRWIVGTKTITAALSGKTATVNVNALGRIQIQ